MFTLMERSWTDKAAAYDALASDLTALLHGERDLVANAANMAVADLALAPGAQLGGLLSAQGRGARARALSGQASCVRIGLGRGVCGSAAASRTSIVVPDVDAFPGHIACDSASRSELVVPIVSGERLLGVLDLDAPTIGRFDDVDRQGCERLVEIFVRATDARQG